MWALSVGVVVIAVLVAGYRFARGIAPWWESLAVLLPWWLTGDFAVTLYGVKLDLFLVPLVIGSLALVRNRARIDWRKPHVALGVAVFATAALTSAYGARLGAWLELVKLATAVAAYLCITASLRQVRDFEHFIRLFVGSAGVLFAFLLAQYLFVFDQPGLGTSLKAPLLAKKNQVGMVVAAIFPVALAYYGSRATFLHTSLLPVGLLGAAAFFSYARASWVICSLVLVLALFAFPWKQIAMAAGSVVAAIVLIFAMLAVASTGAAPAPVLAVDSETPGQHEAIVDRLARSVESMGIGGDPGYSVSTRLEMVYDGLRSFAQRPLLGEGFGTYERTFRWHTFESPHNDFIEIAVEQGLLGLVPFVSFLAVLMRGLWRAWRRSRSWTATAGLLLLVSRLGHSFFEIQYTTAFVWICFGLCAAAADLTASETPRPNGTEEKRGASQP